MHVFITALHSVIKYSLIDVVRSTLAALTPESLICCSPDLTPPPHDSDHDRFERCAHKCPKQSQFLEGGGGRESMRPTKTH